MAAVECRLAKIVMSESHDRQVVVLEEKEGARRFPIIIGFFEVFAIHRFVNGEPPPRPLTHELIGNILQGIDVTVDRIIVNDLHDMTFYARLILKKDGQTFDVDSRPSDAIALAVQMDAPIYVEEDVIEEASQDFD
ncbi:MAG: bifunctional nuclease family protein [Planctomycetes bacterium]|nr:bifunctional nuclease family protein [Planctomycetota bacterium]